LPIAQEKQENANNDLRVKKTNRQRSRKVCFGNIFWKGGVEGL